MKIHLVGGESKFYKMEYKKCKKNTWPSRIFEKKLNIYEEELFALTKNGKSIVLGKKPNSKSIILQSNDYLCMANNKNVINAQIEMLQNCDRELVMSAIFLHEGSPKDTLEKKFAQYIGYENAILTQSGWAANSGLIQVIADKDIPVYIDFFMHMSFREGTKNSDAPFYLFRHNDAEHLEKLIRKNGPGVVVVESVYSTIGTVSPLVDIIDVAIQYHCVSVVDESHSLGIYGPYGSGLVAALDLTEKVHFVTASLSKAFAGRAGIIFCNHTFAKYYPYVAYPAIFSSTLLLPEIAGLFATLDSMIHANERRQDLHKNADYLRSGLKDLEYNIKSQSPIIALESGTEHQTEILRDALENRNVFGSVFCAPATPKNRSLIRFSLNSNLQRNELDHILSVCAEVREEVGMWDWRSTRGKKIVLNKR